VVYIITTGLSVSNLLSKSEVTLPNARVHTCSYTFEHKICKNAIFEIFLIVTLKIILYFILI